MIRPRATSAAVFTQGGLLVVRFSGVTPPPYEIHLTRDDEATSLAVAIPPPLDRLVGYVLKPHGPAHSAGIAQGSYGGCWLALQAVPATATMLQSGMPDWARILRIINVLRLVPEYGELLWQDVARDAVLASEGEPATSALTQRLAGEAVNVANAILAMAS